MSYLKMMIKNTFMYKLSILYYDRSNISLKELILIKQVYQKKVIFVTIVIF